MLGKRLKQADVRPLSTPAGKEALSWRPKISLRNDWELFLELAKIMLIVTTFGLIVAWYCWR